MMPAALARSCFSELNRPSLTPNELELAEIRASESSAQYCRKKGEFDILTLNSAELFI